MAEKDAGVVDEPIGSIDEDGLDIRKHSDALVKFITKSATPLTIGIQGEWGSGKTSLLNTIRQELESDAQIKQVWINSWENSLLATPEESLIKIINEIIDELITSDTDKQKREKILNAASSVFKGALRVGATMTMGLKAGEVTDELLSGLDKNGIKELRNSLIELVQDIRDRQTNPYKKIVIYVDDLDRVEPKDAVKILELLKNIFSVPSCVFVLAIDYQVVVKGLEDKFGKQTHDNEWEFRAFFDKIIQLPFMMPMGQYNIANYVASLLKNVGYAHGEKLSPEIITDIIKCTIGGNPRSLKRLVNSAALIEIFSSGSVNPNLDLLLDKVKQAELLFALICVQIAYPDIYNILASNPGIDSWNEELSYEITKGKEVDDEKFYRDFDIAVSTEDFDEEWEQFIYRVCYIKSRYRLKAIDISRALGIIKNRIIGLDAQKTELAIDAIMNQTAVTNVTFTDQLQKSRNVWKSEEEKTDANELWNLLLDKLENKCELFSKGNRSGSSGVIRVRNSNYPDVTFWMGQLGNLIGIRVEGKSIERNLAIFDHLFKARSQIEKECGLSLEWKRSINSKRQSITVVDNFFQEFSSKYSLKGDSVPSREGWGEYLTWMDRHAPSIEKAFLNGLSSLDKDSLPN